VQAGAGSNEEAYEGRESKVGQALRWPHPNRWTVVSLLKTRRSIWFDRRKADTFLDNGAVIFLDDAGRVEISAEIPRDNS
jgi:hypothetical protein